MKLLTADESRDWALQHGFPINQSFGHPIASEVRPQLLFLMPSDAGARVALARGLWQRAAAESTESLLWVTDWGVWPSGEHPPLAEAVRRGVGADRPLHEGPGHLFAEGQEDAALSILTLSVLFLWDCWLLPAGEHPCVFVSHDEYGIVGTCHGDGGLAQFLRALDVSAV
jgi:hypothetical protein